MERSTLAKWLAGLAIAIVIGFIAGRQQQMLDNQREILRELQELRTARPAQEADAADAPKEFDLKIEGAPVRGAADARLTMIEFSDFECPYCGRYMRETYPQIDHDYVSTGKIRYVFRHFPLVSMHPRALKAGEAGECASRQGKFWPFHDRLFANQKLLDRDSLSTHARDTGLDMKTFASCLDGQAASTVLADLNTGNRIGVTATPTFFFGFAQPDGSVKVVETLVGARPFSAFQTVLNGMLQSGDSGSPR